MSVLSASTTCAATCGAGRPQRVSAGWKLWPARAAAADAAGRGRGDLTVELPVTLALVPLATAIAANHVLLKPSEHTPRTSAFLADLLASVFPPDRVAVVQGGADVAAAVSSLPLDHLLFTGSTAVGQVMAAAAEHLVPVTLELGGKSPAIVCRDFPLDKAARWPPASGSTRARPASRRITC